MRHRHGYRKLNRTSSHRKALLKNLAIALVKYGKIEITTAKAKELKSYFDKLITKAKVGDLNSHRLIFALLQDKECTKKLVEEIAPTYKERNGGYTKIYKTALRTGDAACMSVITLA